MECASLAAQLGEHAVATMIGMIRGMAYDGRAIMLIIRSGKSQFQTEMSGEWNPITLASCDHDKTSGHRLGWVRLRCYAPECFAKTAAEQFRTETNGEALNETS